MLGLLFAVVIVFLILVAAEVLRRNKIIRGEVTRKFVHIMVGIVVATWPLFLSWSQIRLMAIAFAAVVLVDRRLRILKGIHGVQRKTVGDILFPVGIGLTTFVTHSPWIFAAAMLHLSLGDGIAAIVGRHYARRHYYLLFGHRKSYIGSLVFWIISVGITSWIVWFSPLGLQPVAWALLIVLPLMTTLLESLSIFGIDNVTIPLFVAVVLSGLRVG